MLDEADFLSGPKTAEYTPSNIDLAWWDNKQPIFAWRYIPWMLRDPRVRLGLAMLKGPLTSGVKIKVMTKDRPPTDEEPGGPVYKFVCDTLNKFWLNSAYIALTAFEWGFSGSEVMYEERDGYVHFDHLVQLQAPDVRAVTLAGELCGMRVQRVRTRRRKAVYVGGPKCFWHVHAPGVSRWYGQSRCYGAFHPWWDRWSEGGSRATTRLWHYKHAYDGGTFYFPEGETILPGGQKVPNKWIARRMGEASKTGGFRTLPSSRDPLTGNLLWEWQQAEMGSPATTLLDYDDRLAQEILEGMEIPPEVARAEDITGALAGRRVTEKAFQAILQIPFNQLVFAVLAQIVRPLVWFNFGPSEYVDLIPQPLGDDLLKSREYDDREPPSVVAQIERNGVDPEGNAQLQGAGRLNVDDAA